MTVLHESDFETGDLSEWSSTWQEDYLSVGAPAAMNGDYGLSVSNPPSGESYVLYDVYSNHGEIYHTRAGFRFDPNGIETFSGDRDYAQIYYQIDADIGVKYDNGTYYIFAHAFDMNGEHRTTEVEISDGPHTIELEWEAPATSISADGWMTFWVDGVEIETITDLNDRYQVSEIYLGFVWDTPGSFSGTMYFDNFSANDDGTQIFVEAPVEEYGTVQARPGTIVDVEIGYGGEYAQIGRFDVSVGSDGFEQTGKNKSIVAQGFATKKLTQWEPDANFDYWSQTKVAANPADLTKLIRVSGHWSGTTSIMLDSLNVDGMLYAVDRQSRNQQVRARFKVSAAALLATNYIPEFGIILQYFSSVDLGKNGLIAYYSDGDVNLGIMRGDEITTTLGTATATVVGDSWYWIMAEFHDCYIKVYWGAETTVGDKTTIAWTSLITATYEEDEPPWVRDDFIGRGALYMKNVTPHSMCYPFTSSELIIPVEANSAFPTSDNVIVDSEVISYSGKSYSTPQTDLSPALGDAIVGNVNEAGIVGWHDFAYDDGTQYSAIIQKIVLPANFFTNGVKLYIKKKNGEGDDLRIALYQGPRSTKNPVGVKICAARIANEDISETGSWVVGNFGTPMFLNKTNSYWIIASQSEDPGDPTNPGFEAAYTTTPDVQGTCYVFDEDNDQWESKSGDILFSLLGSTSVNAWTIILDDSFTPPTDVAQYNDMALIVTSGMGQWEMFKVTGYGGTTDAGNYIVFVDRDPSGVIGNDSVLTLAPTLKVSLRGALNGDGDPTEPTFHGRVMCSVYRDFSPECNAFRYYSSEPDMRLEDIIAELAAKAGAYAYGDKRMATSFSIQTDQYSPTISSRNAIVRYKSGDGEVTTYFHFGAATIGTDGFKLKVSSTAIELKDVATNTVLDTRSGTWTLTNAWITVSLFENHLSVWINNYFVHSFNIEDYGYTGMDGMLNALFFDPDNGNPHIVYVDWSQCDQLRDNYIFDMGQTGMSLLSDLIKERRVFFQDDSNGDLRVFRDRTVIETDDPINFAALSSSNTTDSEFYTRLRLVGGDIAEGMSRSAMYSYGNIFRLKYSQLLDYREEIVDEVKRSLVDSTATLDAHSLVGAFHPKVEVNDVVNTLVDGTRAANIVVDALDINVSMDEESVFSDMQIDGHLYIPYDAGSDVIVSSLESSLDWSDGNEDPVSTSRKILCITSNGVVYEYEPTAQGLLLACAKTGNGNTVFVPPGTYNYTSPTILWTKSALVGAGKTSTFITGTVTVGLRYGSKMKDICVETNSGTGWEIEPSIYQAVYCYQSSSISNSRISITGNNHHVVGLVCLSGTSTLDDVDISAKATGTVGGNSAEAFCIMSVATSVSASGGEFFSSDKIIAYTDHPPIEGYTIGPVTITGAVQVEDL